MGEDYLRNVIEGNWGCESETSSFTHSDNRHPWEDEVNSQGELFYVMHYPYSSDKAAQKQDNVLMNDTNDKATPGILGRLIRRRNSRRSFRRKENDKENSKCELEPSTIPEDGSKPSTSKKNVFFDSNLESTNIYMKIDFLNIKIIGRRTTAIETFLGLKVTYQGSRIIINDVIPNSPASFIQSAFHKGDWLHSINGIVMTPENIESYLRNISFSKEVKEVVLTIQRNKPSIVKCEPTTSTASYEQDHEMESFGVLFLHLGRSADMISTEDVVFCYPSDRNVISSIRGAFLTLLHLLPSLGANIPVSSTLIIKEQLIHVIYTTKDDGIMLLAMPDSRISLKEMHLVNADVVRCLLFTFQSLSRGFSTERNINSLNKFFHALFKRVSNRQTDHLDKLYEFESLLPSATRLLLPHDIYVQVDDALNELEANDIEGYEEQRLFSVIGSSYFFKGYNICSHLSKDDVVDITSLCRQSDISALMKEGVSELVFWKEVYPASMSRGLASHIHAPYSLLPASWYLLIVAKDHSFLFVLLESGGYTARPLQQPGPNVLYVEEALATLQHIIKIGIGQAANKIIKENNEQNVKLPQNHSLPAADSILSSSLSEITLNKQHSFSYHSLDGALLARSRNNINTIANSGYDSVSSDDCAPVIGRRAERELAMETLSRASDISDESDWNKELKSSSRGQSASSQELEANIQSKITAGKNVVMMHYVHLDNASGILISSVNNPQELNSVLNNFRFHAHKIHSILKNTISFKKLKMQEVSSSTINKSMIGIKEHGIMFECSNVGAESQAYWVVGRIFFNPHLKEVYLCYRDTCPQSMIEVAFRLSLNFVAQMY